MMTEYLGDNWFQITTTDVHKVTIRTTDTVGITHHAFERALQMLGTIDTHVAEALLQTVMNFRFTHTQMPEVSYTIGDSIYGDRMGLVYI